MSILLVWHDFLKIVLQPLILSMNPTSGSMVVGVVVSVIILLFVYTISIHRIFSSFVDLPGQLMKYIGGAIEQTGEHELENRQNSMMKQLMIQSDKLIPSSSNSSAGGPTSSLDIAENKPTTTSEGLNQGNARA